LTDKNGSWLLTPIYDFSGSDGANPYARVVFGPDGSLYGTTATGGCGNGGTVFNLKPSASACKAALCPWTETVLYCFQQSDTYPGYGDLIFDQAGNIYGTTIGGGDLGRGTVFMLTPSNGAWTETILHIFGHGSDGRFPYGGVIFDNAGNLYGTTQYGGDLGCYSGSGCGIVFQLAPSGTGWIENVLHVFADYAFPTAGLFSDQSGNYYGATIAGGQYNGGIVFDLVSSGGNWTFNTIDNFDLTPFQGPRATLTMDAAGNLYGTTYGGGDLGRGSVFKLAPSGGNWVLTTLYSFTDKDDGGYPSSSVTIDANGNLYGTTYYGGNGQCSFGCGVTWEITP